MKLAPYCTELVLVDGGTFMMGSNAKPIEQPIIQVSIPTFWIGKYLLTFEEFDIFCKDTNWEKPAQYRPDRIGYPVHTISWYDAQAYLNWLSSKVNKKLRLPTETEWEFAAKGGIHSKGYKYSGSNNLDEVGWYGLNTKWSNPKIGMLKPDELGIYDMSGLKGEFCEDEWHNNLSMTPLNGLPLKIGKSIKKVLKNTDCMLTKPFSCEITRRYGISSKAQGSNYSFRIAMSF